MRAAWMIVVVTVASPFLCGSTAKLSAQQPAASPPDDGDLDAALLEDLGGDLFVEDGGLGAESGDSSVGEDIGQSYRDDDPAGPLERIGSRMRSAQRLLAGRDASGGASRLQARIVQDLNELIDEVQRRRKQSQRGGKSSPGSQRSDAQPQGSRAGQAGRDGDQPAADATDELRRGTAGGSAAADLRAMREKVFKHLWGQLPERDRERMLQSQDDEFLPKYELEIEQYFRRLAEDPHLDER